MIRLSLILLAASLASSAPAQPCLLHSDVTALDVEAIIAEHTLWRSPGDLPHAKDVVDQFAGVREYVQSTYGIDPDYFVAMLNEADWSFLRDARPGCLGPFGRSENFADLGVMATPVEADMTFQTCRTLVENLGPVGAARLADETGMVTDSTCYRVSTSSWMPMYTSLLSAGYFGDLHEEAVAWPARLAAQFIATDVFRNAHPELAETRSVVARTFTDAFVARSGPPDIRSYEASHTDWTETDFEQLSYYLYWFETLAGGLVDDLGPSFAADLRDVLTNGGVPSDADGWLAVFEELDPGLWSVLTRSDDQIVLPSSVKLESAFPNPFSRSMSVGYTLSVPARVSIELVDATGRSVLSMEAGQETAGRHESRVETADLPSGVYLLRLTAGPWTRSRPIALVR